MAFWNPAARGAAPDEPSTGGPNLVTPTWGGKQFWQDELFFHRWHIQRNVLTGHCRLLDGDDRRHAWGTFAECRNRLDQIRAQQKLPPMRGTGVVVLHGLMRSSSTMDRFCEDLRQASGWSVFNVTYPTTRGSVDRHAAALAKVIETLEGIDQLHFVAHSLGNLVIRRFLAEDHRAADSRFQRMVMLGPPNQGARLAEMFGRNSLFDVVVGASGRQIARDWAALAAELATPRFEFGIIAGGRGDDKGYNPLLREDNDLVVEVRSTRLPGAADFAVLPVLHTVMMNDATVRRYTLQFLQSGYFLSPERRRPIPAEG